MIVVKKQKDNSFDKDGNYWLNIWEEFSLSKASCCAVMGCNKTDLVGAHVQNINKQSDTFYILPLCKRHANFISPMLANPIVPMIPVKVATHEIENQEVYTF